MKLDSGTEKIGLLGHPVGHSKSPEMMNRAFAALNLPFVYLAFDVAPTALSSAVEGMRSLGFKGWNITIPHKVAIRECLDILDESAEEIGAVNTVVNREGRLIGYNTDGAGYLRSLTEETSLNPSGQKVVLLGAGGAARAVGYALATAGVQRITVANRTQGKAEALAERLNRWVHADVVSFSEVGEAIREAALLVNTTSVGMHPHTEEIPIDPSSLHTGLIVSDLIYRPPQTRLLQEAKRRGAEVHNGMGMLVRQAALAFELWTGREAPLEVMRSTLEEALEEIHR